MTDTSELERLKRAMADAALEAHIQRVNEKEGM